MNALEGLRAPDRTRVMARPFSTRLLAEAAGIPAGPIYSVPEARADPHARARGMVQEIAHPLAGRVKGLGNPINLSASPATMRKAAPLLGEDTEGILAELAYGVDEIARLRDKGVLGP